MRTNCVNCGAAIDISEVKCPFCGTTYFDLTAIDFAPQSPPTVLKLRIPTAKGSLIFSMLAKPSLETIKVTNNNMTFRGRYGEHIMQMTESVNTDVGVSFRAIQPSRETNKLFDLRIEKE